MNSWRQKLPVLAVLDSPYERPLVFQPVRKLAKLIKRELQLLIIFRPYDFCTTVVCLSYYTLWMTSLKEALIQLIHGSKCICDGTPELCEVFCGCCSVSQAPGQCISFDCLKPFLRFSQKRVFPKVKTVATVVWDEVNTCLPLQCVQQLSF